MEETMNSQLMDNLSRSRSEIESSTKKII